MEFHAQAAIYLQIAEFIEEQILTGLWQERLPAVRELAAKLKVNPNTVMRAYTHLETHAVISLTRGVGYFVIEEARAKILTLRKNIFLQTTVPAFLKSMQLLGVSWEEVMQLGI